MHILLGAIAAIVLPLLGLATAGDVGLATGVAIDITLLAITIR